MSIDPKEWSTYISRAIASIVRPLFLSPSQSSPSSSPNPYKKTKNVLRKVFSWWQLRTINHFGVLMILLVIGRLRMFKGWMMNCTCRGVFFFTPISLTLPSHPPFLPNPSLLPHLFLPPLISPSLPPPSYLHRSLAPRQPANPPTHPPTHRFLALDTGKNTVDFIPLLRYLPYPLAEYKKFAREYFDLAERTYRGLMDDVRGCLVSLGMGLDWDWGDGEWYWYWRMVYYYRKKEDP